LYWTKKFVTDYKNLYSIINNLLLALFWKYL
jgi:hypothetical protein